jgi:hypothetical protein
MLPRRITGLCRKQQKRMSVMVAMAQKAGKNLFHIQDLFVVVVLLCMIVVAI